MTNLTEQCKQRKLPDGLYWVKHDGVINILDNYEAHLTEVDEVLAEVPSYEEWQDVKDDLATCDKDLNNVCEQKEELYEENEQLKELLKECKLAIFDYPPYDLASDKIRLQIKINQVLGEE